MLSIEQKSVIENHLSKPQEIVEKSSEDIFRVFVIRNGKTVRDKELLNQIAGLMKTNYQNRYSRWERLLHKLNITNALFKKLASKYIKEYYRDFGIYISDDIFKEIKVVQIYDDISKEKQLDGSANCLIAKVDGRIASFEEKLHTAIHEILHIIERRLYKIKLSENSDKSWSQTWYTNVIGNNKIGVFINEGFVELISSHICTKEKMLTKAIYKESIYIVDKIISHLAENNQEQYKKIMDYLIKGNLLGDMRYMLIVKDTLGKEFTRELWNLSFDDGPWLITFMEKYPEVFWEKKVSPYIKEYIWPIDWEYPFEEK